jgi:transcription termination factor Rho
MESIAIFCGKVNDVNMENEITILELVSFESLRPVHPENVLPIECLEACQERESAP